MEKTAKNPYAINFGKLPEQYIGRDLLIDSIVEELTSDMIQNQCFMLTGMRGSGKTVTMTAIEKQIGDMNNWLVIRLNSSRNMLESLVGKLYDSRKFISDFIEKGLNLSKFGIGLNLEEKPPVADIESALEIILKEIKKKKMRLLVTIDEVLNNDYMREFAGSFQIMIRQELPVFLIMAGLYENIRDLENEDNMTFLFRTPHYEMEPLNMTLIAEQYMKTLKVGHDQAMDMAIVTKGYPFAYQALGKFLWEDEKHEMNQVVLAKLDEALAYYVYSKIWSELSKKDKMFMTCIAKKDEISTAEVLEGTRQKQNEFSQYRARLKDKGLIKVNARGSLSCPLPRFSMFIEGQHF